MINILLDKDQYYVRLDQYYVKTMINILLDEDQYYVRQG